MDNELLLKLERVSRDRDFFILNKDAIFKAFDYVDNLLSKFIDVCCMKFKTFKVNKVSYSYGSVLTVATGFLVANELYFRNAKGNAIEYLKRDMFPLYVEEYNATTLVEEKTLSHMLNGCVSEYLDLIHKVTSYKTDTFDKYIDSSLPSFYKRYFKNGKN